MIKFYEPTYNVGLCNLSNFKYKIGSLNNYNYIYKNVRGS